MTEIFFRNKITTVDKLQNDEKVIYGLMIDPKFRKSLLRFWEMFPKNQDGSINKKCFVNVLKLFYKQILPFFQKERIIQKIACDNLHLILNQECITTINFDSFCEFFANFAFLWTEKTNVASAISLVRHLLDRCVKIIIKMTGNQSISLFYIKDGTETVVGSYMKVRFLNSNRIKESMSAQRKDLTNAYTIYVEEEVCQDNDTLGAAHQNVNANITYKLLTFDEVVPLGFSAENAITCLKNQDFNFEEASPPFMDAEGPLLTEFKHHVYHFNKPLANDNICDTVKGIFETNPDMLVSVAIPNYGLGDGLSNQDCFLLNPFLQRKIFFYYLTRKNGQQFFFNTKSSFYNFEEYLIDRVEKYRNEWYKSQKVKEQKENQYDPPKTIPPQTNDYNFKTYLVDVNTQKQAMFATQKHEDLEVKLDQQIQSIMDDDDHKEVEVREKSSFPLENYFKQQLVDWEEERREERERAEQQAIQATKDEAKKLVDEKRVERERKVKEGIPLSEQEVLEQKDEQEQQELDEKSSKADSKLQSREQSRQSKVRPSTQGADETEELDFREMQIKYDFRPPDQFGYLSIVNEPVNRNWKYQYESKDCELPTDTTWPFFDFVQQYANAKPFKILVLSKPKSGRSIYCQHLCDKLNLELVTIDRPFKEIQKKVKKNTEDPQLDENDQPIEFLKPEERAIWDALMAGKKAPQEHLLTCLNNYLKSAKTITKGFVLDVPLNAIEVEDEIYPEWEEEEEDVVPEKPKEEGEEGEEGEEAPQVEEEQPEDGDEEDPDKKKKEEKPKEPPLPTPDFQFISWADHLCVGNLAIPDENFSHIIELSNTQDEILKFIDGIEEERKNRGQVLWSEYNLQIVKRKRKRKKKKLKRDDDEEGEDDADDDEEEEQQAEDDEEEEEEEDDDDDEDPNKEKPFVVKRPKKTPKAKNLFKRRNEDGDLINDQLREYNELVRPKFNDMINQLPNSQYIKLKCDGIPPEKLVESTVSQLNIPNYLQLEKMPEEADPDKFVAKMLQELRLRPIARPQEEGGLKELLLTGLEDEDGAQLPARQWSSYMTTDPVALSNGKLQEGKPEFPATYASRVYLFTSEKNQKEFLATPRKFLIDKPKMPSTYNIAIMGPSSSGKQTIATMLSKRYGWKVINFAEILKDTIKNQMGCKHVACNPEGGLIHLSKEELDKYLRGQGIELHHLWPIVANDFGVKLMERSKRPEKPKPVDPNDPDGEKEKEEETQKKGKKEKKKKKKKKGKRKKKKRKKGEEDEGPPPIEDLLLSELAPVLDKEYKPPPIQGIILVGFPNNKSQMKSLKEFGVKLDQILILNDAEGDEGEGEEEEGEGGSQLLKRPGYRTKNSLESNQAYMLEMIKFLKEDAWVAEEGEEQEAQEQEEGAEPIEVFNPEEQVHLIPLDGSANELFNKICTVIDPFYAKVYDGGDGDRFRMDADVGKIPDPIHDDKEIDIEPIPWGEYGHFCPVTFVEDNWLVPGNQEEEECTLFVYGKKYCFYSDKQAKKFKRRIEFYVNQQFVKIPPPRIMLIGMRGSGVTTQLKKLKQKYDIPTLDLHDRYKEYLEKEKLLRRAKRKFQKVGFLNPEVEDDGEGNVTVTVPKDEDNDDIMQDGEDFNPEKHEVDMMNKIFNPVGSLFVDGSFYVAEGDDAPDYSEEKLLELLQKTRRLPEMLILFLVSNANMKKRLYHKDKITAEYEEEMKAYRAKRKVYLDFKNNQWLAKKEEAKKESLAEGNEWNDEDFEKAEDSESGDDAAEPEEDNPKPAKPEALGGQGEDGEEGRLDKILNDLNTQWESDKDKVSELWYNSFKEANIPIRVINAERNIDQVFNSLDFHLKPLLCQRKNMFERKFFQFVPIQKFLPAFENNYCYQKSKYGPQNALQLELLPKQSKFPLIYRDRIYYFNNTKEREMVQQQPRKYLVNKAVNHDLNFVPKVFVIGLPKTGKTVLAEMIEKGLDIVKISMSDVLKAVLDRPEGLVAREACDQLRNGNIPSDEICLELLSRRLQELDCVQRGYVLDGYPQNLKQAELLKKHQIIPTEVIVLKLTDCQIKIRASQVDHTSDPFGYDMRIIHKRICNSKPELQSLENYYGELYRNCFYIDPTISKWGMYEQAKNLIFESRKVRQQFAIAIKSKEPVNLSKLNLPKQLIINKLSWFKTFSTVSLREFPYKLRPINIYSDTLTYFKNRFYLFQSQEEISLFEKYAKTYLHNPKFKLLDKAHFKEDLQPHRLSTFECNTASNQLRNEGYCPVALMDNFKLTKGLPYLMASYKGDVHCFGDAACLLKFLKTPQLFENAQLPTKMPSPDLRPIYKKKAQQDDCTQYLDLHLGEIMMKILSQIGDKRIKYPNINSQETALKFIAISLKANNPNQNAFYRKKYRNKLAQFLRDCKLSDEFKKTYEKRSKFVQKQQSNGASAKNWTGEDEESYLKTAERYAAFRQNMLSKKEGTYFFKFMR